MKTFLSILFLGSSLFSFGQMQIHTVDVSTNDLVYDSTTDRIYVSIPSSNGPNGNSIGVINPQTYSLENTIFMGSEPSVLAISDDGQYVYSGFNGASIVRRFDIASQTAGLQFSLGADISTGALFAEDIEVMPGHPTTIAISRKNSGFSPRHEGVAIYDNENLREETTPGHTGSNKIEFTSENTLIGYNNESTEYGIRTLLVDSSGVSNTSVTANVLTGFYQDFVFYNNTMYSTAGQVIDVSGTPFSSGQFTGVNGPVTYDEINNMVCYGNYDYDGNIIFKRFDPNTFLLIDELPVPQAIGEVKQIISCGQDCYAFNTNNDQVVIINESNLDVSEFELSNQIVLYPNPTTDYITIDSHFEIKELVLLDLKGKVLIQSTNPNSEISLGAFDSGIYMLKLIDENGNMTVNKIIKS